MLKNTKPSQKQKRRGQLWNHTCEVIACSLQEDGDLHINFNSLNPKSLKWYPVSSRYLWNSQKSNHPIRKSLYSLISTLDEKVLADSISKKLINYKIAKGKSEQKAIFFFSILESTGFILRTFQLSVLILIKEI